MDIATPSGPRPIIRLRLLLLKTEEQLKDALQRPRDVREKGLHIVTTWRFETETRTGRFWMREDIMRQVMDRRNGCAAVKDLAVTWAD
ncbi:hypothetical protein E4T42_04162 [Aureobasidium subglaciale]|nr:hypothetical protein E4T42_04162 [Aureobasidium subglaciale]